MSVIESLTHNPDMGLARDDVINGLRSFPVGAHVIFYRRRGAVLTIHAVVGRRIDIHRHFAK
jgi:plasmid stabilization system protein ParE